MNAFENKTIWITGASSGIGEGLALEWAKYRPNLILSGRNIDKLEMVKDRCISKGAQCTVIPIDLTISSSISEAVNTVVSKHDTVDILVNNGGISQRSLSVETSLDVERSIMETNFFGAVALTKLVLPYMIKSGSGHIVVMSSIVGKFGFPLRTTYSASKHALQGYFESLRLELINQNINVTIVSPGRIATPISLNSVDKDGNKYGKMDQGQATGMAIDICSEKIIKAIKNNKRDVLVGGSELLMVFIHKFVPALYYKLASKIKPT